GPQLSGHDSHRCFNPDVVGPDDPHHHALSGAEARVPSATLIRRMKLRRQRTIAAPDPGFERREIACDSEAAAHADAERQQASEDDAEAQWVYLKPEATGQWVARRTPRHPDQPKPDIWDRLFALFLGSSWS